MINTPRSGLPLRGSRVSSERMAGLRLSSEFDLATWFAEETVWWHRGVTPSTGLHPTAGGAVMHSPRLKPKTS